MFETVVKKLVKVIGPDFYIATPDLGSSEDLSPLSLVERKASRWWLGSNRYYTTNFTLQHVVQGTDPLQVKIENEKDLATFNKSSTLKVNASLSGNFKDVFNAELDNVDSVTLKAQLGDLHLTEVNEQSLLDQLKQRKLDMRHELIKELVEKNRRAVCVVIGVVKTKAAATISATLNVQVSGDEKVNVAAGGEEMKADVENDRTRTINLPAGTVLAYQLRELAVSDLGSMRVMVSHGSKGGFHSKKVDEVDDASIAVVNPESVTSYFKGLSLLEAEQRKTLVVKLLAMCPDTDLLHQLSTKLYSAAGSSASSEIQGVLKCLSGHTQDAATTSVQLLCRLMRNLDVEDRHFLSAVKPDDLPMLTAIVERTYAGSSLSYGTGNAQQFVTKAGAALNFLTLGLEYKLDKGNIVPPGSSQQQLNSAYAVLSGLLMCYGNGEGFVFE